MKVEKVKAGEEYDASKLGRVAKASDATGTDEVSAHGMRVDFTCAGCGAALTAWMEVDPQRFVCPDCGTVNIVWM
jgi:predicted RNA-binding Zn-ribbon protein involved in translation (DUF1610 family)